MTPIRSAFVAVGWLAACAAPAAAPPGAPRDLHGDPLPAGAVSRLGGARLRQLNGWPKFAFSADGRLLATAGGPAVVWEVRTGRAVARLDHGERAVEGLCFSPDGKKLVTLHERLAYLWDVRTGAREPLGAGGPDRGAVVQVAFVPGQSALVLHCVKREGQESRSVLRLYDLGTRK